MTVLLLALLAPQDLADETRFDDIGLALRLPAGWKAAPCAPPAILKVAGDAGELRVILAQPDEPASVKSLAAQTREWVKKNQPEAATVADEEAPVAGAKAHRLQLRGKEASHWKVSIARSPVELYFLDVSHRDEAAGKALLAKILESVRFWTPEPTKEEAARAEAAAAQLKRAKLPAGALGEAHFLIEIADAVAGRWRTRVREAEVRGRAGYELESVYVQARGDGGRLVETVKGRFLLDGSFQKLDVELAVEPKGGARRVHTVSAQIEDGTCTLNRVVDGVADDTSFAAPGAYLSDVAECVRAALAAQGKANYTLRTVQAFRDRAGLDALEVAAPEKTKVSGGERVMRVVLSRLDRGASRVLRFENDGALESVRRAGIHLAIRRCSRDEFEKHE